VLAGDAHLLEFVGSFIFTDFLIPVNIIYVITLRIGFLTRTVPRRDIQLTVVTHLVSNVHKMSISTTP